MSDSTWPDLNRMNFFLLGYMKEEIHQAWPDSITECKQRIQNFIISIPDDLLQRLIGRFVSRK